MVTPRKVGGAVWRGAIEEIAELVSEGLDITDKFFEEPSPGPARAQQLASQIMRRFAVIQDRLYELEKIIKKAE